MRKLPLFVMLAVIFTTAVYAETDDKNITNETNNTNFLVSALTAKDVDCKKCHTDIPHIIHASKPVNCEDCHGDKKSVAIPQCIKCHDGPIHKVHAGKIEKGCQYCHKNINPIHTNLIGDAVCSHCHKDLLEVHGQNQSCAKCHKTPPNIVKPLKAEGMVLICQNCHPANSVATIHGDVDNRQGCYNCHKGASKINGSELPHTIHQDKASCKDCHEEKGTVIVPKCTKCHKIDELHAFNKIGKLTSQSGLRCPICHSDIAKAETIKTNVTKNADNITNSDNILVDNTGEVDNDIDIGDIVKGTTIIPISDKEKESQKIPGFEFIPGIVILYIIARKCGRKEL